MINIHQIQPRSRSTWSESSLTRRWLSGRRSVEPSHSPFNCLSVATD